MMVVAVCDGLAGRGHLFGLATLAVGILTGGLLLVAGFGMSLAAYWLASRNQAVRLRRRLLVAAIFCGAAGLTASLTATLLWVAAGRPFFS